MDLKYPPKPKNLEIPHPALTLVLSSSATLCHALFAKLFFFLFLAARFVSLYTFPPLYPLFFSLSTKFESLRLWRFLWGFCCCCCCCYCCCMGFLWFECGFCLGFVWFVCGFCFIVFSMVCIEFVFIFYFYFRLWVCNANYVFDEMFLWTVDIHK